MSGPLPQPAGVNLHSSTKVAVSLQARSQSVGQAVNSQVAQRIAARPRSCWYLKDSKSLYIRPVFLYFHLLIYTACLHRSAAPSPPKCAQLGSKEQAPHKLHQKGTFRAAFPRAQRACSRRAVTPQKAMGQTA